MAVITAIIPKIVVAKTSKIKYQFFFKLSIIFSRLAPIGCNPDYYKLDTLLYNIRNWEFHKKSALDIDLLLKLVSLLVGFLVVRNRY